MNSINSTLQMLVDMKGDCDVIDDQLAELQAITASKIIETLKSRPGVILGDDVGMGKTYMAIATIYYYLHNNPEKPVIIVTPTWMLRKKWTDDLRKFMEKNDKAGMLSEKDILMINKGSGCENLKQFASGLDNKRIMVVPVDMFANTSWKYEKAFFLNCWFRHKGLRGKTREEIMHLLTFNKSLVSNPYETKWMWTSYPKIPEHGYKLLDEAYLNKEMNCEHLNNGIEYLRNIALNAILPEFSLFILDEAHKVKNPETKKHKVLTHMLNRKYGRSLFLTATPFQLSENELFTVLKLFENANAPEIDMEDFKRDCSYLFQEVREYINSVNCFEQVWSSLRPDEECEFDRKIEGFSEIHTGDAEFTFRCYKDALARKEALQEVMKRFVIRNVKDKSKYRQEITGGMKSKDRDSITIGSEHFIPFALWEKTLYEIFQKKDRTFIPTVKQSLTSSFQALEASSIYKREDLNALNTLKKLVPHLGKHPKMEELAENVTAALERNEKSLIFCGRIETVKELKRRMEDYYLSKQAKDIDTLFHEQSENAFEYYQNRFYNKQDVAWYYLQENYIISILNQALAGKPHGIIAEEIAGEVAEAYQRFNRTKKTNLMFLKRITEQIVVRKAIVKHDFDINTCNDNLKFHLVNILSNDYIQYGINNVEDEFERELEQESSEDSSLKNISIDMVRRIMDYQGIWSRYSELLNHLSPIEREDVVDNLIRFMQRDKSFFIELKKNEAIFQDKERAELIPEIFFKGNNFNWGSATRRFLENYIKAAKAERENMLYGLRASSVVDIITGEVSDSRREKVKDGFNTPFYPMVLISMPLAQEGIDLQKECRRVIHYDLEWNPAALEQRVGRIDRVGSLISRIIKDGDSESKLEIYYPYIKNTIDESIYITVKSREKWFSFILGGTPDWDSFSLEEGVKVLPENICKSLQIDLSAN